jgi:hypothetical protein
MVRERPGNCNGCRVASERWRLAEAERAWGGRGEAGVDQPVFFRPAAIPLMLSMIASSSAA